MSLVSGTRSSGRIRISTRARSPAYEGDYVQQPELGIEGLGLHHPGYEAPLADEIGDETVVARDRDWLRRVPLQDLATAHHAHLVRHANARADRGHQDPLMPPTSAGRRVLTLRRFAQFHVEVWKRFVHQQHGRARRQRAPVRRVAAAAGQFVRVAFAHAGGPVASEADVRPERLRSTAGFLRSPNRCFGDRQVGNSA